MEHEIIVENRIFVFSTEYCNIFNKMEVRTHEKIKDEIGYKYLYIDREKYSTFLASKKKSEKIARKHIKKRLKKEKRTKQLNEKANR